MSGEYQLFTLYSCFSAVSNGWLDALQLAEGELGGRAPVPGYYSVPQAVQQFKRHQGKLLGLVGNSVDSQGAGSQANSHVLSPHFIQIFFFFQNVTSSDLSSAMVSFKISVPIFSSSLLCFINYHSTYQKEIYK